MPLTSTPLGPVRILQVEDCPEDAELQAMQLTDAGLEAEFLRVDGEAELRTALDAQRFDLVLSDLSLPGFDGYAALRIVRQHDPILPFVFVSGTIGEDAAVQALQTGANDYILKHSPARLPSAVARAIREARSEREHERAQKELMRSQRLDSLALLAAGLSHDLRNILQPLLIVPDLLATYSDHPRVHKLGQVVAESGRRGHEMAESMLSFVRGSRRDTEPVALATLFEAVQLLLRGSLPKHVTLEVQAPPADLVVEANFTEFQQCLINLCLNGIQAMDQGGKLVLRADVVRDGGDEWIRVQVSDQGKGMDASIRNQLFTPFFTTKEAGTGLGLISCKRIVETVGGKIRVESEPGRGTTFELLLPVPVAEDAELAVVADRAYTEGQGQRILLVDGDTTRLSLLANALASQGYDPMYAKDGAAALRMVEEGGMPALVIVDSDILLLSAVSLLLALSESGYQGPVLILEDPLQQRSYEDLPPGMAARTLPKPVEMGALFRAVEKALAPEGR